MPDINKMHFSKESVAAGEMTEFIDLLLKQSYGESDNFNDIHIYPTDCGAFYVEWLQRTWNQILDVPQFVVLEPDQVVMLEKELPDGTYIAVYSEEEYEEHYKEWIAQHPTWKQNQFGRWYDPSEFE